MPQTRQHAPCALDTASAIAEFELAVWSDPVYFGDWPASVKERNPRNLMTITPELARPRCLPCKVMRPALHILWAMGARALHMGA